MYLAGPKPPSDKQLIDQYAENRAIFDRLAEMFATENEFSHVYAESGQCVTVERQTIEPGEDEKCDQYVQLFRALEFELTDVSIPAYLTVYSWGLMSGISKGFVYAPDPRVLDGVIQTDTRYHGKAGVRNVPLGDGWYIFRAGTYS